MHMNFLPARFILTTILMLGVAGCPTVPFGTQPGVPSVSQAEQIEAQGDFAGAAMAYLKLADANRGSARQAYQLSAAAAALRAGDVGLARNLVNAVALKGLDSKLLPRRQLLDGEVALSEGNPQQTLSALKNLTQPDVSSAIQKQAYLLRAEAYLQSGDPVTSVRERVVLEGLLTDPIALRDNQTAIVQTLLGVPGATLLQLGAKPPEVVSGWAELALIKQGAHDPAQFQKRIGDWRKRYPQHPATQELLAVLPDLQRAFSQAPLTGAPIAPGVALPIGSPQRIALLLPLSGPFAQASTAVRDSFMAAAGQRAGAKPEIRVYDVGVSNPDEQAAKTVQIYQQAVQEGANFVVGPLEKDGVQGLFSLGALPVPSLALNYVDEGSTAPPNLYQFGLAPEDEARQVAERAWLDGHSRALVLIPQGEWGQRMLVAFSTRLEQLGGIVVESQTYDPDEKKDFSPPVRTLLQFSEGNEAKGIKPARRQDADYVFMAAFPRQARGLRPQLAYFFAGDLPTYATSHVYAGTADSVADQDLDGILFTDIPWVLSETTPQQTLRQILASQQPGAFNQLKRLYALGVDAFNVIAQLDRIRGSPGEHFEGETGSLSLDAGHRVHRQLLWARFEQGVVTTASASGVAP
jgi:outer membrane PBP1 activator LpoA protein